MRASSSVASARRRSRVVRVSSSVSRAASMARRRSAATSASVRRCESSSEADCANARLSDSAAESMPIRWCAVSSAPACARSCSSRARRRVSRPAASPVSARCSSARVSRSRRRRSRSARRSSSRAANALCAARASRSSSRRGGSSPSPRCRADLSSSTRRSTPSSAARASARRRPSASSSRRRAKRPDASAAGPATRTIGPRTTSRPRVTNVDPGCRSASASASARCSTKAVGGRAARSARESPAWLSRTASQPIAPSGRSVRASWRQSARTMRAAGERAHRFDRARHVAGGEQGVGVGAEDESDGVFPARARTDAVRQRAVRGEARAADHAGELVDARLPRAQRLGDRREAVLERAGRFPRRLAGRLGLDERGGDGRQLLLDPGDRGRRAGRCGGEPRGLLLGLGGLLLAAHELFDDLRRGLVQARERRRDPFGGEVHLVAGVARGDPLAGCREGVAARLFELALEHRARGRRVRGLPVRFLAGERTGARLGDGALEAIFEVRQVAGGAGLFRREVAPLALEGGAAAGQVDRGPPVGVEHRVVAGDRGLERGQHLAQRVALAGGLVGVEPCRGERRLGARERGRGLGLAVAPFVADALGRPERIAQDVAAGAHERRLALAQQLRLFLVARGPRGLALQGRHVALDLRDDVGEAQQVALRFLELALGEALLELVLRDAGGLFDQAPAVLGLGREDLVDAALLDDRVRAHAEAGAEQLVLDVAQAHLLVVQEVFAVAVAVDAPSHAQRPVGVALLAVAVGGGQGQDDFRHSERAPLGGAVEDDVVHLFAAQDLGALLAEGPGDRVADVRLAAAVGSDDGRDRARKGQIDLLVEGLEARDFDPF